MAAKFAHSMTISEPEAEQSFNETSDDGYLNMNLKATAFVPTPKGRGNRGGPSQASLFFAPKTEVGSANNYRSVPVPVKPPSSARQNGGGPNATPAGFMDKLNYLQGEKTVTGKQSTLQKSPAVSKTGQASGTTADYSRASKTPK